MNILVTGASGFIGSHLIPALVEKRHKVSVLKRKKSTLKSLGTIQDMFTVYDYKDFTDIQNAFDHSEPELVIHLATLYINKHKAQDITQLIHSNVLFGTQVLEAFCNIGGRNFLNFGTRWQHFNNTRYTPVNLYTATKQAFFDILCYYATKGICSKTLELCDTFGKNDTRKKIVSLLIEACKQKKHLELSAGEQILDITFVDALITYILQNIEKNVFFNNTIEQIEGTQIQLKELGTLIEKISGVKGYLHWGAKPYRENEVMSPPICEEIARVKLSFNLQQVIPPPPTHTHIRKCVTKETKMRAA